MSASAMMSVSVSSHGLGHLSQVSAVLNALSAIQPEVRIEIRSSIPDDLIRGWLDSPFHYTAAHDDVGMKMKNALQVDLATSQAAYANLHRNWDEKVRKLGAHFQASGTSLVVSDIAYLPLAAAQSVGIPSVALCSLNWADVLACYLPDQTDWLETAQSAYRGADVFIVPTPGMGMPWLRNQASIGPLGRKGAERKAEMVSMLGLPEGCILVLVGMGGVAHALDGSAWPTEIDGKPVCYLAPDDLQGNTPRSFSVSALPFTYVDIVASSDLVITKPGYGMFVEAAGAGVPILYVRRDDWPDVQSLCDWINLVGHSEWVSESLLSSDKLYEPMTRLLNIGRYKPVDLNGAIQAAEIITRYIS